MSYPGNLLQRLTPQQRLQSVNSKAPANWAVDHLSSTETPLNTLQNVKLFDFPWVHVEPIYQVSLPFQIVGQTEFFSLG